MPCQLISQLQLIPVKVGVGGSLDVEIPPADIVDGLVVDHEGTVGVLQSGVRGQDRVVRLNNGGGDLKVYFI